MDQAIGHCAVYPKQKYVSGKNYWSKKHLDWLQELELSHPVLKGTLQQLFDSSFIVAVNIGKNMIDVTKGAISSFIFCRDSIFFKPFHYIGKQLPNVI